MSVLSNGPFNYNRFDGIDDSMNSAYRAIYEKKAKPDFLDMDGDGNKKESFKKAVKDKEKGCKDCGKDKCECDHKKDVKEDLEGLIDTVELTQDDVLDYLVENGFANNLVSAEVLFNHMSDEWLLQIESSCGSKKRKKKMYESMASKERTKEIMSGGKARSREFEHGSTRGSQTPSGNLSRSATGSRGREFEHGSTRGSQTPSGNLSRNRGNQKYPKDSKGNYIP